MPARRTFSLLALALPIIGWGCWPGRGLEAGIRLANPSRVLLGVGDRLRIERNGRAISLPAEARALGIRLDLFSIWLPRGWQSDWVPAADVAALRRDGVTPVFLHYFFGDGISRERILEEREAWLADVARLGRLVSRWPGALVVIEPEFNDAPPDGETAVVDWPGFAEELRHAVRLLRAAAPAARVGVCAGDFSPSRGLEVPLGGVSAELDFLAFQEMRAATAPDPADRVGDASSLATAAVDFAGYLRERFGLPILLAYVAVSSYGGGEAAQAEVLRELGKRLPALRSRGVFGVSYFQLRDDPKHRGYFGPAESHFGLLNADGSPKPALKAFRALR